MNRKVYAFFMQFETLINALKRETTPNYKVQAYRGAHTCSSLQSSQANLWQVKRLYFLNVFGMATNYLVLLDILEAAAGFY